MINVSHVKVPMMHQIQYWELRLSLAESHKCLQTGQCTVTAAKV